MKKIIKKLLLTLFIFLFTSKSCLAFGGFSVNVPSTGGNSGNGNTPNRDADGNLFTTWTSSTDSTITYKCTYNYSVGVADDVKVYGYNQNGESIIEGDITPTENIKSGTFIGLNITETKTVWYSVTKSEVTGTKTTPGETKYTCCTYYRCKHAGDNCNSNLIQSIIGFKIPLLVIKNPYCLPYYTYHINNPGNCERFTNCKYNQSTTLRGYYCEETTQEPTVEPITSIPAAEQTKCNNLAKDAAVAAANGAMYPSYELNLYDPNPLPNTQSTIVKTVRANNCGGGLSRTVQRKTCNYSYNVNNVCMDPKTAHIEYRDGDCKQNEMRVDGGSTGGINYWRYFVPLNYKSNQSFLLSMSPLSANGIQSADFCKTVINNYPNNYRSFITDSSGNQLSGNKNTATRLVTNGDRSNGIAPGCIVASTINIPIEQKFYNEKTENNTKKILGYGSYFRQIDVNNPFPNGLSANSFWNGYYNRTNNIYGLKDAAGNNLDASRPFARKTYVADLKKSNIDAIKAFNNNEGNSDKVYTSWKTMKSDGTSSFIKSEYGVTRIVDKNSFYKLGCGPANKNWGACGG